jgi:hypothetical protein
MWATRYAQRLGAGALALLALSCTFAENAIIHTLHRKVAVFELEESVIDPETQSTTTCLICETGQMVLGRFQLSGLPGTGFHSLPSSENWRGHASKDVQEWEKIPVVFTAESPPQLAAPIFCNGLPSLVDWAMYRVDVVTNFMVQNLSRHHISQNWHPIPPGCFRFRNVINVQPYCCRRGFPSS